MDNSRNGSPHQNVVGPHARLSSSPDDATGSFIVVSGITPPAATGIDIAGAAEATAPPSPLRRAGADSQSAAQASRQHASSVSKGTSIAFSSSDTSDSLATASNGDLLPFSLWGGECLLQRVDGVLLLTLLPEAPPADRSLVLPVQSGSGAPSGPAATSQHYLQLLVQNPSFARSAAGAGLLQVNRGDLFVTNGRLLFASSHVIRSIEYGCVEQISASGCSEDDEQLQVQQFDGSTVPGQEEFGEPPRPASGGPHLPLKSDASEGDDPAVCGARDPFVPEEKTGCPVVVAAESAVRPQRWPMLRVDRRGDAGGLDYSLLLAFVPGVSSRRRADVQQLIRSLCFPSSLSGVFAFVHRPDYHRPLEGGASGTGHALLPGSSVYDPVAEFARMGIVNNDAGHSDDQCANCKLIAQGELRLAVDEPAACKKSHPSISSANANEEAASAAGRAADEARPGDGNAGQQGDGLTEIFVADSDDEDGHAAAGENQVRPASAPPTRGGRAESEQDGVGGGASEHVGGRGGWRQLWDRTLDFIGVQGDGAAATTAGSSAAGEHRKVSAPPLAADGQLILQHAEQQLAPCGRCSGWRLSQGNRAWALAPTCDATLVVPSVISDDELAQGAAFRDKRRLPLLSWRDPRTGASLSKGAQPRTGMSRQRSAADERLLQAMRLAAGRRDATLYIVDARPMVNALAQMAMGSGYENLAYYPRCELEFLGIANIHAVRSARQRVRALCRRERLAARGSGAESWFSAVESSLWLSHLRSVLVGAERVARLLAHGHSVFLHCSDGWDRTPQVASLAQLLIDPYYRTGLGFCVLIEKEWICGGHKFAQRLGQCDADVGAPDRSPVWLQFLECVWNLLVQHPTAFEFTSSLLMALAECSHSLMWGTFLGNCARDRAKLGTAERTPSVWTYLFSEQCVKDHGEWRNPLYIHSRGVLLIDTSSRCCKLWDEFHLKRLSSSGFAYSVESNNFLLNQVRSLKLSLLEKEKELNELIELRNKINSFQ